jgi:Mrp family chromosome partitioning ATPase
MVRDISKPRWVCGTCGTCFEEDKDAAQRCEDAGPPDVLPAGELLLEYGEYGPRRGWHAEPLTPVGGIKTSASRWNTDAGHIARYELAGVRTDRGPRPVSAAALWPHQPGVLQVYQQAHMSGFGRLKPRTGGHAELAAWAARLTGLPFPGDNAIRRDKLDTVTGQHREPSRVRPVTPEVRAVFDLLDATADQITGDPYSAGTALGVLAAEATSVRDGLPDRAYNPARLAWWLAGQDRDALLAKARTRQAAWFAGQDITAPTPRLRSRAWRGGGRLSKSKLRRAEQEIIAATGVEWPDRETATAYLNLLLRKTLEIPMTSTAEGPGSPLFSTVAERIAVTSSKGGVGKTTTAAALALALADAGRRVWLVDLNLPNPGQHIMFGLGPAATDPAAGLIRGTAVNPRLRVFSHAQLFPPDRPQDAVLDIGMAAEWIAFLAGVLDLRGTDVIVFDLPPGWGAVHKVIFDEYTTALTGVVHVTTGHPLALATETFPAGDHIPAGRRWLLENMSRATGPVTGGGKGKTAEIRLHGTSDDAVRDLAAARGLDYAGSLPWIPDPAALAASPEMTALAAQIAGADVLASAGP